MAGLAPSRPTLALIANDQEWSSRSLESTLEPVGYAFIRAYNGQQAIELAVDNSPDVIIIDATLPDMPGIEVCRRIRRDPRVTIGTPIVITTAGRLTRHDRLEALKAGAWDFCGWPIDVEEFTLRLGLFLKAKLEADQTREDSLIDHDTGLYNLRGLMRRARELGSDAYRHSRALACVALALQPPNGMMIGNGDDSEIWELLEVLGDAFKMNARVSDAVGRVRQGEFLVVAPATDDVGALTLAERLTAAIESVVEEIDRAPLTVLAGYHAVDDLRESGVQPSELMAGATTALRRLQIDPGEKRISRHVGS